MFLALTRAKAALVSQRDYVAAVDAIGALKRAEDLMRDLKAELGKSIAQLEKVACALYMRSPAIGQPVRGEWFTGTPGASSRMRLPKQGTPEHHELMQYLGVANDSLVKLHYPSIMSYLAGLEEAGKELPPHINPHESETDYTVRCVLHRDIDLDTIGDTTDGQ